MGRKTTQLEALRAETQRFEHCAPKISVAAHKEVTIWRVGVDTGGDEMKKCEFHAQLSLVEAFLVGFCIQNRALRFSVCLTVSRVCTDAETAFSRLAGLSL